MVFFQTVEDTKEWIICDANGKEKSPRFPNYADCLKHYHENMMPDEESASNVMQLEDKRRNRK